MSRDLFLIGLLSLVAQIVVFRELAVAFFGIELIYSLALAGWLLASACGATAVGRKTQASPSTISRLFLLTALLVPLELVFIRGLRLVFGGVAGAYLTFPLQLLALVLAIAPLGFMSGLLFRHTARLFTKDNRSATLAYSIECLGGFVGGLLATLGFQAGIQNATMAVLCTAAATCASVSLPFRGCLRRNPGTMFLLMLLGGTLPWVPLADQYLTSWNHPHLVATRDTRYSRVTITALEDQIAVFENDALSFETEGTAAEEFAHVAALHHPHPRRILVLGGGIEGLVAELLSHQPDLITYVELNGQLLELALPLLPTHQREAFLIPTVSVVIADPRNYLRDCAPYDLILVGLPEPSSAQANRYYTTEFYRLCAARLSPDGILAFRLRAAENIWTEQVQVRSGSIVKALRQSFRATVVLPGTTNIILASATELCSPDELAVRYKARNLQTRLVSSQYLKYLYTNTRYHQIKDLLLKSDAPVNTDVRPVCFQLTQLIWLAQFFPSLSYFDWNRATRLVTGSLPLKLGILFGCGGLFFISRLRDSVRRIVVATLAGFIGMVVETVLLLYYQAKTGVLFQNLGLLFTMFMLGLAAGALVATRVSELIGNRRRFLRIYGVVVFGSSVLLFTVLTSHLNAGAGSSFLPIALALVLSGFVTAGVFGYATVIGHPNQSKIAAQLFAADLFGGCLATVMAIFFMIPLLGLPTTTLLMAVLAGLGIALI